MSAKRYLDFENRFRGDREKIIEQFSKYDKYEGTTIMKYRVRGYIQLCAQCHSGAGT